MQNLVSESLQIVGEELAVTFNDVRAALEQYADGEKKPQSMERCLGLLRTAIGVLRMTETYGASLLTEEMEATGRYLGNLQAQDSSSDEAMEALSRAAVQLPAYVERIINGGRDIPLVLLPLLNDLRAARGKPLLSESTLLLLNISSPSRQEAHMASRKISGEDVARLSRELRPQFQLALLGWIKDVGSKVSLQQIAQVSERLEQAATTMEVHQLWWVVGGIVEALLNDGLEAGVSLKRLIGQVDREMKRLMTVGEVQYSEHPPTELINNLLYYIARSTHAGARVVAIRAAFNLSDLIPGDDQVEIVRESLAAPSAKLMTTVSEAIREDLARVKDVLDIYVRTGMENVEELEPQIDLLKKIGDTMGVLGLGELRETIEAKRQQLLHVIEKGERVEESTLMEMASALLKVEDHLEEQLFGMIRPAGDDLEDEQGIVPDSADSDHELVARAVMRESLVNLSRVKEAVTHMLEKPGDGAMLDSVPQYLRGITAGLLILEKESAVMVVDEIGRFIGQLVQVGDGEVERKQLDLLADAIVSLEYYLETLQAGRKEPLYMLENAKACLRVLRERGSDAIVDIPDGEFAGDATTMQLITPESTTADAEAQPASGVPTAPPPQQSAEPEGVAPEIIELFIEEAGEEIELISRLYPEWEQSEDGRLALVNMRRSFHTLKGSGRVVGAALIGDFCWSVENLLNRLINSTLTQTPEILECVGRAVRLLPQLLEQLEVGTPPEGDIQGLIAELEALAAHQPPSERPSGSALGPTPLEPALLEILTKETGSHLATLTAFIEESRQSAPPYAISEEVYRACHTLHGSVTMAKAEPLAKITEPLNQMVRRAYDSGLAVDESVVSACTDVVGCMEALLDKLADGGANLPDTSELEARLEEIAESIEAQVALKDAQTPADDTIPVKVVIDGGEVGTDEPAIEDESGEEAASEFQPDFDPEIAAIFSDEANELLESIDAALTKTSSGGLSEASLGELQRYLHTLKGGARMAGLSAMGDLSHSLETFLLRISNGDLRQDSSRLRLLQQSVDELHRLGERVAQGVVEKPLPSLIEELQAALTAPDSVEALALEPAEHEAPEPEIAEADIAEPEDRAEFVEAQEAPEPEAGSMLEDLPADVQAGTPASAIPDLPGALPAADQISKLARELREPATPESGDLTDLIPRPVPEAPMPDRRDFARVHQSVLDQLLNNAGEVSIFHSRLSQQMTQIQFGLDELGQTVFRLRDQLRGLESATEAQIIYQHRPGTSGQDTQDPLQLERYSKIQQLSRALGETANDVSSLRDILQNVAGDTETLLVQQARTASELQDSLMRTRMVPFGQHAGRLARLVRQMATEEGKQVDLSVQGGGEIDRQVLEKMLSPFEHMIRNAVIHGIESPAEREAAGKPAVGNVLINIYREGSQVVVKISDDGRGMDADSIRRKAVELGLTDEDADIPDEDVLQLILRSGFSTADRLTQTSGRGIGMDVVASEVAQIGGTLRIATTKGKGTTFTVRLPFTLAVTQALIVRVGSELYALPLPTVEGVIRIPREEFREKMQQDEPSIDYGNQNYKLHYLGQYLGSGAARIPDDQDRISVILIEAGNKSTAVVTDETMESREVIVKPLGRQLGSISGLSGATILGDGRVAIILDVGALVRLVTPSSEPLELVQTKEDDQLVALVVDDSITMRRVSQRLLERNGMRVMTARDGLQAVEVVRDHVPDIILLDVEMPRMDGYEFASFVRNNPETADVPIIMITSRVSDEHKARAIELGVDDYLGKPYQEDVLIAAVHNLLIED